MITALTPVGQMGSGGQHTAALSITRAAIALEAEFLAEMLKSAGVGKSPADFNGGAGEAQYESIFSRAQAERIAKSGGIGLAEIFFNALKTQSQVTGSEATDE